MEREAIGPKVLGFVLWVVSFALGIVALLAAHETIRIVASFVVPMQAGETVAFAGQIRFVSILSLFGLGVIWLVWHIAIAELYTRTPYMTVLARRFGITTAVQAGIVGVYLLVSWILL
jgi:hypothetical protein